MTLWQDRAYTTIQATNSLPTMADDDRWSPRRPSDLAAEQAKAQLVKSRLQRSTLIRLLSPPLKAVS